MVELPLLLQKTRARTPALLLLFCLFTFSWKTEAFTTLPHSPTIIRQGLDCKSRLICSARRLAQEEIAQTSNSTFFLNDGFEEPSVSVGSLLRSDQQPSKDYMIYVMMALIFAVGSLASLDRVAMSVALVPMSEEMGYTETMKGSVSSLFSVGYGLGIVPAGLLLASLSPRNIMAVGITIWSLGTLATPYSAAQTSVVFLLGARALVGASESVVVPTVQRLLLNWVPPEKKSIAVATVFAGFQTGTILAYSISPFLIDIFDDWRALFYIYGAAGLLYLIPWLAFAQDEPIAASGDAHYLVKQNTKEALSPFDEAKNILKSAPWKDFVQSKGVWAMFLAHAANNWGLYNNLSWTPTFYYEQYGLNVKESALLLIIPSLAGAIGGLSAGTIADRVIQNMDEVNDEEVTKIRKCFQGIALLGPSICLGTLSYSMPENPVVAQCLLTVAVGLQSFNAAGYGAANQEKAGEKWTGLLYSVTSLPSVMLGTFAVQLTGKILDYTDKNWSIVFGLNSMVYFLGASAFVLLYDSKKEFD